MKYLLIAFLTISFTACKHGPKKVSSEKSWDFERIYFSSGGGFTGKYDRYILLNSGELFKINNRDTLQIKQLKDQSLDSINNIVLDINLESAPDFPGNITYNLEIKASDFYYKARWGDENYSPPAPLLRLFEILSLQSKNINR